jgi:hypothetical protein
MTRRVEGAFKIEIYCGKLLFFSNWGCGARIFFEALENSFAPP